MVEIKNMSNEELQIRLLTLEEEFEAKKNAIKKMCDELGINTIEELANSDINLLTRHFKSMGNLIHDYANGIDTSKVENMYGLFEGIRRNRSFNRGNTESSLQK